jgi:carboxylate-amine ligase
MNRAMRWLPLFLALSTSSPFWNRRRTGLLSYRQAAYDEWPRTGIPDFFADEAEYRAFTSLLERAGALRDQSFLWWAIRPAARFPTLELRIADACTRLDDTLAIAALFRCLVALLVRCPELGGSRNAMTRRIIDENRWRAKRDGIAARFIDDATGDTIPLPEMLAELRSLIAEDAQRLRCDETLAALHPIVASGTSAHAQLALYQERRAAGEGRVAALRRVVDWLIETTVPGLPPSG